MKHTNCIRRCEHESSYFQGYFQTYGRYQWDIKYYGWMDEFEIEAARRWSLGDYCYKTGQFEYLNEVVGRPVQASIEGRSGGWLVIDTELTPEELSKVDQHVEACLKALSEFLKEERELSK